MISILNYGIKFHVWIVKELKIWYIGFVLEMPRAFNKGEHPVLSYVQLRIYKISKNVAGPNIEFVSKDKIENKLLKMFNVQLFGNSYLSRWEWDDWAWAEEMRENGGDQHFLKLTLSLPTSAHCSLPTTSAHLILAKLSKLPPGISLQLWMKNPRLV